MTHTTLSINWTTGSQITNKYMLWYDLIYTPPSPPIGERPSNPGGGGEHKNTFVSLVFCVLYIYVSHSIYIYYYYCAFLYIIHPPPPLLSRLSGEKGVGWGYYIQECTIIIIYIYRMRHIYIQYKKN